MYIPKEGLAGWAPPMMSAESNFEKSVSYQKKDGRGQAGYSGEIPSLRSHSPLGLFSCDARRL